MAALDENGPGNPDDDEWFILSIDQLNHDKALKEAVAGFEGDSQHAVSEEGVSWLKSHAAHERACVTRLLFNAGRLAAFYSLSSAEVEITRPKELERLGIQGGSRVPASHIEWVVRSRDFKGVGMRVLQHASVVARDVASIQGNLVLSLDPYDDGTAAMWRGYGFEQSKTKLGKGLRRMYLPLFGYRALRE